MLRSNNNISVKNFHLKVLFVFLLFSFFNKSWGQAILQWNTFGNLGTETTEPSVFNDPNISSVNLTLGAGVTPAANGNRFGGTGWATSATSAGAVTGNNYIQFTLTPTAGCSVTPTSFVFNWDHSGTGPVNVAIRSSADGFATDLGAVVPAAAIGTSNSITISGLTNLTTATIFRIYGYGASAGGGSGGFDVGSNVVNVQLNGSTSCSLACTPPTTTITPTTQTVCAGSVTTVSVTSSAASNTYTWQASTSGSAGTWTNVANGTPSGASYSVTSLANTSVLTVTAGSTFYYHCLVTDAVGSCSTTSGTSTLVVNATTSLTTQTTPSSSVTCFGTATSFSVGATGTSLAYQWQVSTDGITYGNATGGAYTNGTTNVLNIGTAQAAGSYSFQCVVTGACGTLTSNISTLSVKAIPSITLTPLTQTVCSTSGATFVVTSNASTPSYTWQQVNTGGSGWATVVNSTPTGYSYSGTSTATLSIAFGAISTFTRDISVLVADGGVCATRSSTATVVINSPPSITTQPSNVNACAGSNSTISLSTSGSGITYQWQVNNGSGFTNITGAPYTNYTTTTLGITATPIGLNGYTYQCILTSPACGTSTSNISTLSVTAIPSITLTPLTQTICSTSGATFVVTSNASTPSYTWQQVNTGGSGWATVVNGTPTGYTYSGTSTATMSIAFGSISTFTRDISVLVADGGVCATRSSTATVVVNTPLSITGNPPNRTICSGSNTTFTVSASGSPLTYQWQESTGGAFVNISNGGVYSGATAATLSLTGVTSSMNSYSYQCVVSVAACSSSTTSAGLLTVNPTPSNDLCSNAISLSAGTNTVGSLDCASPTAGLTYAVTKNDVWYAFTPTCTATFTVTMTFTTSGADYDLDVFNTGSCPSSGSATYTSHGITGTETVSQSFTSGTTYFIRVIDFATTGGTFSISVAGSCGTSHTVIFDPNGGAGSMSNQTANSATNLTSNAFTNSGCTFVNWNDSANANGTSYANSAVYSFTADVTLYAQWSCSSGGGSAGCPYLVSAVVNACAGSCNAEGRNEIVVMNSGSYAIPVNGTNINLYYSGGTNHYFTNSFAGVSQSTVVANLNTLVATSGCTNTPFIYVASGGTIPANSNFMVLNNNSCFNGSFSAYCNAGPVYVTISTDADWSSGGYFGNNSTPRYFRTDFSNVNSGCGVTTYNYNNPSTFPFSTDGASVSFYGGTTPTYINGNGTCAPAITILPIELVDFYATQDNDKNDLVWKVASEKNVSQYIIEKSEDGINFKEFARVNSIVTEGETIEYTVDDIEPYSNITYYRLNTLENNGKINQYKIIDIDRDNKDWKTLLYQADDNLTLEFKNAIPKNATFELFDLSGVQLATKPVEQMRTTINTARLATGIYFVKISTPYKTENFKIIIPK